ncbi:PAS domain S-box-containing protein [Sphingomonas gellani]|uniref:PAS domain S-box-containing protein n=1 Tax=Sphingomonas gellani TaxID=1166340 RepID=A0A1H8JKY9_9SPHN|nr:PAS domain S-box protein [Sphingomonas gellani]SEN81215.1 PAS domain S-box-containing protein [Sphingomonas gellani]
MYAEGQTLGQCLSDADGIILAADATFLDLLGRDAKEVAGRHAMEFTFAPDRTVNAPMLERLGREDIPFTITKRFVRADGTLLWVTNHVAAVSDGTGLRRIIATSRQVESPITVGLIGRNLAAARRQLRDLDRAKRAFGADLIVSPPWELLLQLYLAEVEGEPISSEDLSDRVHLTIDMTLRWLEVCRMRGLIETEDDAPIAPDGLVRVTLQCQTMLDGVLAAKG